MKFLKGALLLGAMISGLSYSVPYEVSNPLDPAWHNITHTDETKMCKVSEKEPLVYDSTTLRVCKPDTIQAQEENEYDLTKDTKKMKR